MKWADTSVLIMLGALLVLGLIANRASLFQSLLAGGFGVAVVLVGWLWRLTLERAETALPPALWQRAWDAVVFMFWLAVMGALLCYVVTHRKDFHGREVNDAAEVEPMP